MYTARYLGAESFGIISLGLAISGIFQVFTTFGMGDLLVREVARDTSKLSTYLQNMLVLMTFFTLITFGLVVLVVHIFAFSAVTSMVIYIITLSGIIDCFTAASNAAFRAFQKMEYQSLSVILRAILLVIFIVVAISQHATLVGIAVVYVLGSVVILIYSISVLFLKFFQPKFQFDRSFVKVLLLQSWPFFFLGLINIIAFRIDIVILSVMKGNEVVGWYSASYRIIEIFIFIPAAFVGSLYPVLSTFFISSKESLHFTYQKSFKYLVLLGLPIAVGTTLLAEKIILFIYQSAYIQSVRSLQILIWIIPLVFLTYMFGTVLVSINRQKISLAISFSCMVATIILNLIFIPYFSYIGAAVIAVVTTLFSFILQFYFITKNVCKIPLHRFILKPIFASGIMALFIILSPIKNLSLIIVISIGIYFGSFILMKGFSSEDIILFKQIFTRKWREEN
jgi:O-antigen/teichoic acid export membrane protein